jgi:DNA-binding NarL/FixJ family response regulator
MPTPIRILIVDDSAPWRHAVRGIFEIDAEVQFVGEAADGIEAVQKARELKPDLILLDIGLPRLNGIEAAKQINETFPATRIIFLTLNNHAEVVRMALSTGAMGYVLKTDAGKELWPAIKTVLQGKQYVSRGLHLESGTVDRLWTTAHS